MYDWLSNMLPKTVASNIIFKMIYYVFEEDEEGCWRKVLDLFLSLLHHVMSLDIFKYKTLTVDRLSQISTDILQQCMKSTHA